MSGQLSAKTARALQENSDGYQERADWEAQRLESGWIRQIVSAARTVAPPSRKPVWPPQHGVVEARRGGELYGDDRLDALLAAGHELSARSLAAAVAEDAREFAGGDLSDDLAVVVIRRT